MKLTSIRGKLFSILIGAFFCSTITILVIADTKLTDIIDTSKNALYNEKIDAIWGILHRHHERLEKTGLVEAYLEDFKADTLKELKHTYYNRPDLPIYPFIIDTDGNIVMHPTLPENTALTNAPEVARGMLKAEKGAFNSVFMGKEKYYVFRHFPEWQWVIGYAVPLEIKYAEARTFRRLLILIMAGVTLSILLLLVPVITRFTTPIIRLTNAAKAMAEGNLDQEIRIHGNDEISSLAHSFQDMCAAIKQTISELEREIAERKNAEEALANEKEQLAVTLISIGDGVISTDHHGRILLMNKVAEELIGWGSTEVTGRDLKDIFRVVDQQTGKPVNDIAQQIMETGTRMGGDGQATLVSRSGEEFVIASNGAPIRDARQNIIGVILVFRDITKEIEIEQELLKTRKLESLGVLAGGIAHDFNNILAIILGNIDLALMDNNLPANIRTRLTHVEQVTHRAKGLTQQLLTFSKGGAPIKAVSSLENLIRDSANFVLHGCNVTCHFDIPNDLWSAHIDKGQISQVIQNLVTNGCEAMSDTGNIAISGRNVIGGDTADAFLAKGQKYVAISIADNGEGIPAANMDKIFDPYFSTKADGNGLGLAICHSIVSKHSGYISVHSSRDTGTIFTVYLPADKQAVAEAKAVHTVSGAKPATVMIMDDEELVREMVEMMLEEMGHTPVLAAHGSEALELYKKHKESDTPIDIVIMDLTIPGAMGGKDAVQELLAFDPNAKAIVCSGYSNDPVMADPRKYGFRAAIVKPYTYEGLSTIIDRTLRENLS